MKSRGQVDVWFERACQLAAVEVSLAIAFLLKFDLSIPGGEVPVLKRALLAAMLVKLPVFERAGFYRSVRRFASITDLYRVFLANLAGSLLFAIATAWWIGPAMPRSVWLIDAVVCFLVTALIRFYGRIRDEAFPHEGSHETRKGIVIYGAGTAGAQLVHEIRSNRWTRYEVLGFLDDDPLKQGASVRGVQVLGSGRDAPSVIQKLNSHKHAVEEIFIAMPSATGREMREALANCRAAKLPCKTVPAIEELLNGRVSTAQVRNVSVHDLVGRKPVRLNEEPAIASIAGRSILVTGAAGSIGSELCRQLARFEPACLIALDQAESDLFRLENEIRDKFPRLRLVAAVGNIRETDRLAEVMERHRVESIFHAAAYKHVPMMESHIVEAVRNNILGTWNLMRTASRHNVRSLLMISSDKAVNPVCVMGATKRVCERIVSACSSPQLKGVSVRFGNVLGSSGSVVPIFQAQIAAGGPIKVTHPEVRRYFMTASEAVSLVIQASANSRGAEIFVLDMGDPIRIVDLAENMIRLAGLVPHEDIEIQFTGLRPGEKLVEEIIAAGKGSTSYQDKIKIIRDRPLDSATVEDWMDELQRLLTARQEPRILAHIQTMVPEYKAPGKFLELVFGKTLPDETSNSDLAASLPEVPSLSNRKKNGKANGTAGTEEFNLSIP
jgi:FlaA1/EpsC-like NDP-sugar epimerase